jgi:hypothetical protein|tara:strand:- start:75 stop:317 length:243 start_codon:yes stop_codon:yes gene_type:complete
MVKVVLSENFVALTGGCRELHLPVDNYRDVIAELITRWPQLEPLLERSSVAIDGLIYQDAMYETLQNDSEVFFMPRIEGG